MPPPIRPKVNDRTATGGDYMSDRSGVVLYFDVLPALKYLDVKQKGRLFEAILEYAENGKAPDFSDDPILGLAWCFIGPRIDREKGRQAS